jgi:hypothetical protein
VLLDHFGFIHVLDHFTLIGSDEVGWLGWPDSDAVNVSLMLSSVESDQLTILNSFVFVIQTCIF